MIFSAANARRTCDLNCSDPPVAMPAAIEQKGKEAFHCAREECGQWHCSTKKGRPAMPALWCAIAAISSAMASSLAQALAWLLLVVLRPFLVLGLFVLLG